MDFKESFQALENAFESLIKDPLRPIQAVTKRQNSHLSMIPSSGDNHSSAAAAIPSSNTGISSMSNAGISSMSNAGISSMSNAGISSMSSSSCSSSSSDIVSTSEGRENATMLGKKRKHSNTPSVKSKIARLIAQQAVGNLSNRFASQVRLQQEEDQYYVDQVTGSDDLMDGLETVPPLDHHSRPIVASTMPSSAISSIENLVAPPPNPRQLSPFLQNHVDQLSKQAGVSYKSMLDEWIAKKRELESNLEVITKSPAFDSYDDAKIISGKVLELAHWLCGNNFNELRVYVSAWKYAEHSVSNIMRFIRIIEDMKDTIATNQSAILSGQVFLDSETLEQLVRSKKLLYADMLRQNSIAWRVLGYPVQDLEHIIVQFQQTMKFLLWPHLNRVHDFVKSLGNDLSTINHWEKSLGVILDSVALSSEVVQLLGMCPVSWDLIKAASAISVLYLEKCLLLLKTLFKPITKNNTKKHGRFPDAKVCFIYESLIQMFTHLHASKLESDILSSSPTADKVLSTQSSLASITPILPHPGFPVSPHDLISCMTPLCLPSIEAGLELCSYASRTRIGVDGGIKKVILGVCERYIQSLGDLFSDFGNLHGN